MGFTTRQGFFISAIGTDSGKTITSAILVKAIQADYWKPIQAGLPRDTDQVRSLVAEAKTIYYPEAFQLKEPCSPHQAAALEGITIKIDNLKLPEPLSKTPIIVEGAGGLLVPLNNTDVIADLVMKLGLPMILVVNFYLGSINHTLLTLEYIANSSLRLKGVILTGEVNESSWAAIQGRYPKLRVLARIPKLESITKEEIAKVASQLSVTLKQGLGI